MEPKLYNIDDLLNEDLSLKDDVVKRLVFNIIQSSTGAVSEKRLEEMVECARKEIIGANLVVLAVNMLAGMTWDRRDKELMFSQRDISEAKLLCAISDGLPVA